MRSPFPILTSIMQYGNEGYSFDLNATIQRKGELLMRKIAKEENSGKIKMVKKISKVENWNEVLRRSVLRKDDEIFELSKTITAMEENFSKLDAKKEKKYAENRDLKSKVEDLKARKQRIVEEIRKLHKEKEQICTKNQELKENVAPVTSKTGEKKSKKAASLMAAAEDGFVDSLIFETDDDDELTKEDNKRRTMDSQRRTLKAFQNLHTDMVLPNDPSASKRPRIAKYTS